MGLSLYTVITWADAATNAIEECKLVLYEKQLLRAYVGLVKKTAFKEISLQLNIYFIIPADKPRFTTAQFGLHDISKTYYWLLQQQ